MRGVKLTRELKRIWPSGGAPSPFHYAAAPFFPTTIWTEGARWEVSLDLHPRQPPPATRQERATAEPPLHTRRGVRFCAQRCCNEGNASHNCRLVMLRLLGVCLFICLYGEA